MATAKVSSAALLKARGRAVSRAAAQRDRHLAARQRRGHHAHASARRHAGRRRHRLEPQTQAGADHLVELGALAGHQRIVGQARQGGAGAQQQGHDGVRAIGLELARRLREQRGRRRTARHACPGQVDAVEEIPLGGLAEAGLERVGERAAPLGRAEALALVHAAALAGDLGVGAPEQWVVRAEVHAHAPGDRVRPLGSEAEDVPHQASRLPRPHPAQLLREARRVGGGGEGLLGQDPRGGVVPVPAGPVGGEARHDDVGAEAADHPHDVGQDALAPPDLERLVGALRVAEVDRPREELLGAVEAPRAQQLVRADDAEQFAGLRPDEVLAAVAAGQREVAGPHLAAVGQPRQEGGVLVVGVGRHVQGAAHHAEPLEGELQTGGVEDGPGLGVGG